MLDKMAAESHNKSKRWLVTIIFYDTEEKKGTNYLVAFQHSFLVFFVGMFDIKHTTSSN